MWDCLTVLCACSVAKRQTGNALLREQSRYVAWNWLVEDREVGRLGMHAYMPEPEVGCNQGADRSVLDRGPHLPGPPQTHPIEAVQSITDQSEIFFNPELIEALLLPGFRVAAVKQVTATKLTIRIEDVECRDLSSRGVRGVGNTSHAINGPYLLAGS